MAIPQTIIPVLTGKAAERFNRLASEAAKQRGSQYDTHAKERVLKVLKRSRQNGYFLDGIPD